MNKTTRSTVDPREPLTFDQLASLAPPKVEWLWQGYLARRNVTMLTSQWKTGKTTLVSVVLSKFRQGGSLAGMKVRRARAAIVTEEGPQHWRPRGERLGFGESVTFFCRPFVGKPNHDDWRWLVDRLATLKDEKGLDLVVFDTLA